MRALSVFGIMNVSAGAITYLVRCTYKVRWGGRYNLWREQRDPFHERIWLFSGKLFRTFKETACGARVLFSCSCFLLLSAELLSIQAKQRRRPWLCKWQRRASRRLSVCFFRCFSVLPVSPVSCFYCPSRSLRRRGINKCPTLILLLLVNCLQYLHWDRQYRICYMYIFGIVVVLVDVPADQRDRWAAGHAAATGESDGRAIVRRIVVIAGQRDAIRRDQGCTPFHPFHVANIKMCALVIGASRL